MIRKIIHIDEEKCNGCGACAEACHEGAIGMVNGKAKLLRDDYCDGLGDCLPTCPTGAITFVEREAAAYNEAAVKANMAAKAASEGHAIGGGHGMAGGCPGSRMRMMKREGLALKDTGNTAAGTSAPASDVAGARGPVQSQLANWPVQIKLAPVNAPYFDGAKLLIAADCAAYAYANFHQEFIRGKVTLIGCPKLDDVDYSEKLTEIIQNNDIKSVTIVRMEVPCCGGLEMAAKRALQNSGKFIPWQVVTIGIEGNIIE
ncbi:MAG: 4Fe-4S binding protein [Clostridia bacterium]|nr:4Fe-4S binding protein [Clostridia bacterium]